MTAYAMLAIYTGWVLGLAIIGGVLDWYERRTVPKERVRRRIDCAWCGLVLDWGPGPVSHGICPTCRDKWEREAVE